MIKKTYNVEYGPTWWECTIVIDHNKETDASIKVMVEFWTGWKSRLAANGGDYIITFLQQLAREINFIQAEYHYNIIGVRDEFANREGWCKMDGSYGITIEEIDDFDFEHHQYEVQEAPANG
jgi:hypothetical protein